VLLQVGEAVLQVVAGLGSDGRATLQMGFFYKYKPLLSLFVKTNHLKHLLSKLAWRKVEIAPRCTSRHHAWRSKHPATRMGGKVAVAIGFGGKV
jgi:hypothetical protein